jgi:protein O-mannosyl-transferase
MNKSGKKFNKEWLWALVPALVGFLIFMPGVAYPFYPEWDDGGFVFLNPHMVPGWKNALYWLTHDTQTVYTPMPMWSLMFDRWLFGLNTVGFHLHNMLLHGIAGALLYGLLRHLKISCKWACIAAVLWAINPQRIESVVWITERKDVLAGVFSFAAILLFMRGCDRQRISWSALILTCLAMGSKPSTLLLPGIMASYMLYQRRDFKIREYLRLLWPYAIIVIGFYVIFSIISSTGGLTPVVESWPRMLLVPAHNFFWYIITAIIPFELNPIYPRVYVDQRSWTVLICGAAVLLLTGYALIRRLKREQWIYNILPLLISWLCLFMPISAIFRFTNTDYCDRYNYLPGAVVIIAVMLLFNYFMPEISNKGRQSAWLIALLLGVAYLINDFTYIDHWRNSNALFKRAVIVQYPNPKAWVGMGEVGLNNNHAGTLLEAGFGLTWSTSQAKRHLTDDHTCRATGAAFIGIAYAIDGKNKDALKFLVPLAYGLATRKEKVYTPKMLLPRYWLVLSDCYLKARQPREAVKSLAVYLNIPWLKSADRFFATGLQAFLIGDLKRAVAAWRRASELRPEDGKIRHNLQRAEYLLRQKNQKLR